MPFETLTYAALGARLNISHEAARSLARRLKFPRSLSDDGKALVNVDLAEVRHTPRQPRGRAISSSAKIETLKAEIARLEARAADDRADFERERERADRLAVELLQATAETVAAPPGTCAPRNSRGTASKRRMRLILPGCVFMKRQHLRGALTVAPFRMQNPKCPATYLSAL